MADRRRPGRPHTRSTVVTAGVASVRHAFGAKARYIEIHADERVTAALGDSTVTLATMTDANAIAVAAGVVEGEILYDLGGGTVTRTHVAFLASRAGVEVEVREWDQAERDPCSADYYTDPD